MPVAQRDLRRVERAARALDSARDELRRSILLAREAGETFEDIGRAAGLSRQRVQQIVRGE
jgi:DNA-directed RNA polymerase sigma subunit (sigma70/sigma32)